jgi:two-component system sensor histidine kinase MprB
MPLRKRVSWAAAAAAALAVAIAVLVGYAVVRSQLLGQIDSELNAQAQRIENGDFGALGASTRLPGNSANGGAYAPYAQYVESNGVSYHASGELQLPTGAPVRAVAAGNANNVLMTVAVGGSNLRMLVFRATAEDATGALFPVAVELARPLGPVESVLSSLRLILALVFLAGIALAAVLGRIAARRVLAPLAEVTHTAEVIGETDDLSLRLAVHADDEVGQLANRFNAMLERLATSRQALDDSVRSQRQLVADASHELRTPVTSLRTNIEVLLADGELDKDERRQLLDDVVEQSEELSRLVSDLIEVARGDLPEEAVEEIRLDHVVEDAVIRAQRNVAGGEFIADLKPVIVRGSGERLSRAINNLLDNATRHNQPGRPVEVTVDADGVRVRDYGSGIDAEDLPFIFDRFYRGVNSRARQGSGLGLAIVRQVAESHGGSVAAANAPDGGAVFTLKLPGRALAGEDGGRLDDVYGAGGLTTRA